MNTTDSSSATAERRYIVVQRKHKYRLHRRLLLAGAIVAGLAIGGGAGYPLGYHFAERAKADAEQLEVALEQTGAQVENMRGELAVHKHGSEVERQVSEHLRKEIIDLQNRLAEQEQTIAFYKSILDPEKNQALTIHALELSQAAVAGRYTYKLVLIQPLGSDKEIVGTAAISVSGLQSGKQKVLDWKALSGGKRAPAFKFKVFQELLGELMLPEAFIPETLTIRLAPAGAKAGESQDFPWTMARIGH